MTLEGKQADFINAVKANKEYIVVEAPAGTGKTFSCIQAVKALCDSGRLAPYQKVLILTFSRNARAQLLKELSKFALDDEIYKHIDINNYHSFFKKYLDTYRDAIGIQKRLCIVDDEEFICRLYDFACEHGISLDKGIQCTTLDDFIYEKGQLISVNCNSKIKKAKYADVGKFIETAFLFTQTTGVICFAQFRSLMCKILSRLPEMQNAISHDYPVLILDEYQDTNYYQEQFVRSVLQNSSGIFFCDRFQMIYGFRGSTIKRIEELPTLYPGIKKIEFDEYYRYKDKADLVELLTLIRNNESPDYSKLVNGHLLTISVNCNLGWRELNNAKSQKMQCTIYCKGILYQTMKKISMLLRNNKSVAILCRKNIEVDRLIELFYENRFHPKEITDTRDMAIIAKHLKALVSEELSVRVNLVHILSVALLCTSRKRLFGDTISDISKLSYESFKRKTKNGYKLIKSIISSCGDDCGYKVAVDIIDQILNIAESEGEIINYTRRKFFNQCIKLETPTPEGIDGIMLQRQYTNSFTNITPGLYITTIHQSKGKEFDCVFVSDVGQLTKDQNLLYVSHSRMKEKLYPISVIYNGVKYDKRT